MVALVARSRGRRRPGDGSRSGHRFRPLLAPRPRFLTGAIRSLDDLAPDDFRRVGPRFGEAELAANLAIVEVVRELAAERECTPAQLALAWLLAQGDDIVPIPGTRSLERLAENAAAADIELDAAELERIGAAVPDPVGDRYPEAGMADVRRQAGGRRLRRGPRRRRR